MRSCMFFLGVSLSAFSCAYGVTNVGNNLTAPNDTISHAIAASTGSPTLNLTQSVQLESATSSITSTPTKVTINGASGGTKVAPSGTGPNSFLFNDSTPNTLELDFNNLTFQGFSAYYGAVINSEDPNGVTIGGTNSGPVTFMGNRAINDGGVIYANNGSVIFAGDDPVTFRGNQSAANGGAIAVSGSGSVSLNSTGVVNFSGNKAQNGGGAIYTDSGPVNLSGTGPVTFNCNSSQNGGAINAGGALTISGSVPAVFTNNTGLVNGGAINAANAVILTNTQFMGNTAGIGGAVYMSSANSLTYEVDSSVVMNPSTGASQGDNDLAGVSGTTFNKTGDGDLIINTMNPGWLGTTNVNTGRFIVGENLDNTGATWGSSAAPAGAVTVNGTATLGGYGTIYASGVTFTTGSTWLLGLNPNMQTAGLLSLGTGTLTLPSSINTAGDMAVEIDGLMATSIPASGYTVARFGSYNGDLVGLNSLLASSNLTLDASTPGRLILKQFALSKPVQLDSAAYYPTIQTALLEAVNNDTSAHSTSHTVTLTTRIQAESQPNTLSSSAIDGVNDSGVTSITVNGAASGTAVQPATGISPLTLFTTSSGTPALTLSGLTLQGFGSSSQGGAINAVGPVALNNVQFVGNSASSTPGNGGGAVYMSGSSPLSYQADSAITVNPSNLPATLGDNDIAGTSGASFLKTGAGDLVLNTNNSGWLGSTTVNAGKFLIGGDAAHSSAQWGPSTGATGAVNVTGTSTLGGFGTINANSINFASTSTWLLGLTPGKTSPLLNVGSGGLTLPSNIKVEATLPISLTGGLTVANYPSTSSASFTTALTALNHQLAPYNLLLSPNGSNNGLVLTQTQISPGLFLGNFAPGSLAPLTQNVMVTFEVPGFYPANVTIGGTTRPKGTALTTPGSGSYVGEGLLVRYGQPDATWTGATNGTGSSFFTGTIKSIPLNNHYVTSLAVATNQLTVASGSDTVTSWSWTGSVAVPVGQTYVWQLWKTRTYQSTDVEDGVASSYTGGWLAQGKLILTNIGILNVTYQITPGEGSTPALLTPVTPS